MTDLITVTGAVGSDPRHTVTPAGLAITNFRLASTRRYFDRATGAWADGETNWYTVSSFRQLALNSAASIAKGDRIVVHGRLRVRAWETGEKSGTAIEIDADAIGHDLSWGRTVCTKTTAARPSDADAPPASGGSEPASDDAWARPDASSAWPGSEASDPGPHGDGMPGDDAPATERGSRDATEAVPLAVGA